MFQDHQLLQPANCNCDKESGRCPVCDWGLTVCRVCNKAESELDEACLPQITSDTCPHCGGSYAATGGRASKDKHYASDTNPHNQKS